MSGRLPTGGFMMLDRQLLSDPDVRAIRRERQYLVDCCRRWGRRFYAIRTLARRNLPAALKVAIVYRAIWRPFRVRT